MLPKDILHEIRFLIVSEKSIFRFVKTRLNSYYIEIIFKTRVQQEFRNKMKR